ncbi:MAG: DUF58 domain-containing protein [Pirellulaceae bacterium]|nr:DUF58 domain-containing protein [Pirellulaceae bacterium]
MAKRKTIERVSRSRLTRWWRRYKVRRQQRLAWSASHVRFRMTREGTHLTFIVLFISIGAVLRDVNLLILLAASMIGLLLLHWRLAVGTISGLNATRQLPERVVQDATNQCLISVTNPKRWLGAWLVTVEDIFHQVAPVQRRSVARCMAVIDQILPRSTSLATYGIVFHQRGRYQVQSCTLSTRFPMSLGRSWRTLPLDGEVIVHPRLGELMPAAKGLFHSDKEGQHKTSMHAGAHEAEFYGLRPWSRGDSRRWIHWRTSARLGELSVRQFDRLQRRQACVLLDLYLAQGDRSPANVECCEKAVAFLATLASCVARESGMRIAVAIAASESLTLTNVQSPVLVRNLLDELAVVQPAARPEHRDAVQKMSAILLEYPSLLVISTRASRAEQLRTELALDWGPQSAARLAIRWLNASRGELEPLFRWNPSVSNESAAT